ncbi:glutathione transferase [Trifolium repens]|nr:glutathione transferase [Trifolium repens]
MCRAGFAIFSFSFSFGGCSLSVFVRTPYERCGPTGLLAQLQIPRPVSNGFVLELEGIGNRSYLHDQNVVHRDIKSANILIDASGSFKHADFGSAKATKMIDVESCEGKAFWMAPEVCLQSYEQKYRIMVLLFSSVIMLIAWMQDSSLSSTLFSAENDHIK